MRILMLSHYFPSGQMTHVFALARELMRQGHAVHVANGRVRTLRQWRYVRALAGPVPCSIRLGAGHLAALVRRLRVQVIHAHTKRTFAVGARLAERTGVPLVITCHARTLISPEHEPAFAQARRIICPWETLADEMGPRGGRTRVIPNGIDLEQFPFRERLPRETLRVLYLGRVDHLRRPGVEALCQAVKGLAGVELVMASDRPAAPWTQYVGWLANPAPWLAASDVVVGTGRAVLEGLATGCAALVLGEGWDGLLTPENADRLARDNFIGRARGTRPAPDAIRTALLELKQDPERRRALAAWGRRFVAERFDIRRVASQTAALYAEVLAELRDRRAVRPVRG
ncbi:MAG: glycosyltransferase family 4 protein [Bacillota bacterium]